MFNRQQQRGQKINKESPNKARGDEKEKGERGEREKENEIEFDSQSNRTEAR